MVVLLLVLMGGDHDERRTVGLGLLRRVVPDEVFWQDWEVEGSGTAGLRVLDVLVQVASQVFR